jgi:hypothetical protein
MCQVWQQLSSSSRRLSVVAGLLATGAAVLPVFAGQIAAPSRVSPERGKVLFDGLEPMVGRIREHDDTMPSAVVTCSHCHASHGQQAVTGSDAPVLSADFLAARHARRHGPESAYDERSFCRVLRTGADPVYVMLDHVMPVYLLSDAQCESLWRFLVEPGNTSTPPMSPHP